MTGNQAPTPIPLRLLGQSGCRLSFPGCTVYVDPYLSHSVQALDAPDLVRLVPIPLTPAEVTDADWVLITHDHIDHCDPHTLPILAQASPGARFLGPPPVLRALVGWGIAQDRLQPVAEAWFDLAPGVKVQAVPAAHPEISRDQAGCLECVGFVLECSGRRLYIAGDTSVRQPLLDALAALAPVSAAILPVNEKNFFRSRRGIIGNMSIREAFQLADEIGAETVVPVHWDMFAANAVGPAEIEAVYMQMNPTFRLLMQPQHI
jgi:L-ascorbate metabolism protein UlaG (beta-lactamase superfamily)